MSSRDTSRDTPRHVGGNQRGAQNICNSKNRCKSCTTSKFTLTCWECACDGGKYRRKNNCFHRCRTESEHTGMDWRQDDRVGKQGDEEVGTLCTKCYSGHEQNPMLLCDGYVPHRIFLHKKRPFLLHSVFRFSCTILSLLTRQDTHRCDAGWHIQCLDPPLSNVPDGGWVCFLVHDIECVGVRVILSLCVCV